MGLCQNTLNKTGVEDPDQLALQVTAKNAPNQKGDNKENIMNVESQRDGSINNSKNPTNDYANSLHPDNIDSKNRPSDKEKLQKDVGKCQSEVFAQEQGNNKDQEVNDSILLCSS